MRDLHQYPAVFFDHKKDAHVTVGDLHGNSILLLFRLIEHQVLKLGVSDLDAASKYSPSQIYNRYAAIINRFKEGLDAGLTKAMAQLFDTIKLNEDRPALFRLIGDTLCDRGPNDLTTLLLLYRLKTLGANIEIIFSNHDRYFIEAYFLAKENPHKLEGTFFNRLEIYLKHRTRYEESDQHKACFASSFPMIDLFTENTEALKNFFVAFGFDASLSLEQIFDELMNSYFSQLKFLSTDYSGDHLVVYTHAPCGDVLTDLYELSEYLDCSVFTPLAEVEKTSDTVHHEIKEIIDAANEFFKKSMQEFISLPFGDRDIGMHFADNRTPPTAAHLTSYRVMHCFGHDFSIKPKIGAVVPLDSLFGMPITLSLTCNPSKFFRGHALSHRPKSVLRPASILLGKRKRFREEEEKSDRVVTPRVA